MGFGYLMGEKNELRYYIVRAIIIIPRPIINEINMPVISQLTLREDPLNSFHTKTPHAAATMVAPCPSP
jgi:hypothetical protein